MTDPAETQDGLIAVNASGSADAEQLDALITAAWRQALADAKKRQEIADLLDVRGAELDPTTPPFQAHVRGAGTFGAEIVIALATSFAVTLAKDLGSQAGKKAAAALRILWVDYLRDRVSPPGSGRLGPEKENVRGQQGN
jgi:hypothetical protein